jgi:hypothetical protein
MMKDKIIWIGPIVNNEYINKIEAISPAANHWQANFIDALTNNKYDVTLVTYIPMRFWPKEQLWVKYPLSKQNVNFNIISISYLNLPFIRDMWISIALFKKIIKIDNCYKIISYNPVFRHSLCATILQYFYKYIWISIIADDKVKGKPNYSIFLSAGYFNSTVIKNKYLFEGGINLKNTEINNYNKTKVLLYAGSITKWTGIEDFIINYHNVLNDFDLELHIYGKGESKIISEIAKYNTKIKFIGYVDDNTLDNACKNAFAFINPRPLNVLNGDNNFPSKILYYLSYSKPILSTLTLGLSSDLSKILTLYNPSNDQDIIRCLELILDIGYYEKQTKILQNYILQNTWDKKVEILLSKIF